MRISTDDDEGLEVQMAPLIDCVFLLLIFFLVATSLKKLNNELEVELPRSQAAIEAPQSDGLLEIGLDAAGSIFLDGQPATRMDLHDRLREVAAGGTTAPVYLKGDRQAPFQAVMYVLDLCSFEGLNNVRIQAAD